MSQRVGPDADRNWTFPGSNKDVPRISVFRPTWEEFKDFKKYISYIESQNAHCGGIAKIIPPAEWQPRKLANNDLHRLMEEPTLLEKRIRDPICQVVNGQRGVFQAINVSKRSMTVSEFKELASSDRFFPPITDVGQGDDEFEDLERKYWKNVTFVSPIYGADVAGSIMDENLKEWNIRHLDSILDWVDADYNIKIAGVNTAYLYFGMWKASFAWHTEDMDLYSINYLHYGRPKFWYAIPPSYARRFERMANNQFPQLYKECSAYLRHKMCLISPSVLRQHSIPYNKIVQHQNEIIITFPLGYHAGFNTGFNIAESTNFATERWVEYGKRCSKCHCRPDMVNISMDTFVKRLQPDRYHLWLAGRDLGLHPEDDPKHVKPSCAARPTIDDFLQNKANDTIPECMLRAWTVQENNKLNNKLGLSTDLSRRKRRHPIHDKRHSSKSGVTSPPRDFATCDLESSTSSCDDSYDDTSSDDASVKNKTLSHQRRLSELDQLANMSEFERDSLQEIWLKAGEMEPTDADFADDGYFKDRESSCAKRNRPSNCQKGMKFRRSCSEVDDDADAEDSRLKDQDWSIKGQSSRCKSSKKRKPGRKYADQRTKSRQSADKTVGVDVHLSDELHSQGRSTETTVSACGEDRLSSTTAIPLPTTLIVVKQLHHTYYAISEDSTDDSGASESATSRTSTSHRQRDKDRPSRTGAWFPPLVLDPFVVNVSSTGPGSAGGGGSGSMTCSRYKKWNFSSNLDDSAVIMHLEGPQGYKRIYRLALDTLTQLKAVHVQKDSQSTWAVDGCLHPYKKMDLTVLDATNRAFFIHFPVD